MVLPQTDSAGDTVCVSNLEINKNKMTDSAKVSYYLDTIYRNLIYIFYGVYNEACLNVTFIRTKQR